jgi:hypothetical protein
MCLMEAVGQSGHERKEAKNGKTTLLRMDFAIGVKFSDLRDGESSFQAPTLLL